MGKENTVGPKAWEAAMETADSHSVTYQVRIGESGMGYLQIAANLRQGFGWGKLTVFAKNVGEEASRPGPLSIIREKLDTAGRSGNFLITRKEANAEGQFELVFIRDFNGKKPKFSQWIFWQSTFDKKARESFIKDFDWEFGLSLAPLAAQTAAS